MSGQSGFNLKPGSPVLVDNRKRKLLDWLCTPNGYEVAHCHNYWHKIIILQGTRYDKKEILDEILKFLVPNEFLPTKYMPEGEDTVFLVKDCGRAIRQLCLSNLCIYSDKPYSPIMFSIFLNYCSTIDEVISPEDQILMAIRKRYDFSRKILDLSSFHTDENLVDVYCPLSSTTIMKTVLRLIPRISSMVTCLNLSHNAISNIGSLENLSYIKSLKQLDLSYNLILWGDLEKHPPLNLTDIILDGNPLCRSTQPYIYIKRVKTLIPTVKYLDYIEVSKKEQEVLSIKNYVGDEVAFFVDQFLFHYFGKFQTARSDLYQCYDHTAIISVSSTFVRPSPRCQSLSAILDSSRNLLKITDFGKMSNCFEYNGLKNVLKFLTDFPKVILNRKTLTVDVARFEPDRFVLINTTGCFMDNLRNCFHFVFVFFLMPNCICPGEWKIHNHLVFLSESDEEEKVSFMSMDVNFDNEMEPIEFVLSKEEKISEFQEYTTMKRTYCEHFLEEANWNMESALQSFVDQMKDGQLTETFFENPPP